MPIVRIELFPGRDQQLKMEIAESITSMLQEKAGIAPEHTTIQFVEIARENWVVAGKPY